MVTGALRSTKREFPGHLSFRRDCRGFSIVELLISTGVMAVVLTASIGMLVSTLAASRKLMNSTDTVDAVRNAVDKIGKDVRTARAIGDVSGSLITDPNTGSQTVLQGSDVFPSSADQIVNAGSPPPLGWPVWADGSQPTSFQISSNCLIVQVPLFDGNGFPLEVTGSSPVAADVETHIYRVLHRASDPSNEYILQLAVIPGSAVAGVYTPSAAQLGPVTLATGIIGPFPKVSPGSLPGVFQYVNRFDATGTAVNSIPVAQVPSIADYTTVLVNLEIQKHYHSAATGANTYQNTGTWAIKQEMCLRNNAQATSIGLTNVQ